MPVNGGEKQHEICEGHNSFDQYYRAKMAVHVVCATNSAGFVKRRDDGVLRGKNDAVLATQANNGTDTSHSNQSQFKGNLLCSAALACHLLLSTALPAYST
jgi:hypothetical protein